jgi:cell division protein ZapB
MSTAQTDPSTIDQIAERVERLLLRYAEVQRTRQLLQQELDTVIQERDSLRSRLAAARARVEDLLERLPEQSPSDREKP